MSTRPSNVGRAQCLERKPRRKCGTTVLDKGKPNQLCPPSSFSKNPQRGYNFLSPTAAALQDPTTNSRTYHGNFWVPNTSHPQYQTSPVAQKHSTQRKHSLNVASSGHARNERRQEERQTQLREQERPHSQTSVGHSYTFFCGKLAARGSAG